MYFRAVLDDKTCCILESNDLRSIREMLETKKFVYCFNQTTGNEELVSTLKIQVVRKSSKTLAEIVAENKINNKRKRDKYGAI